VNELIRITTDAQGVSVVSARELHGFLDVHKDFSSWIKHRIRKYGLVENQDYVVFAHLGENPNGGRPLVDYILTMDSAKELAMVEGNARGKQARQYFIDAEKALRQLMTVQPAHLQQQQEERIARLEQQLQQMIEAQQQAARSLLEVPRSADPLPIETTRVKIQRIVNGYCRAKGIGQQEVWRRVYDRLYYLYWVSIRSYKRSDRESWLDVAERSNHLEKIYTIVSAELIYTEQ
jgi:phage anti-repressor protein